MFIKNLEDLLKDGAFTLYNTIEEDNFILFFLMPDAKAEIQIDKKKKEIVFQTTGDCDDTIEFIASNINKLFNTGSDISKLEGYSVVNEKIKDSCKAVEVVPFRDILPYKCLSRDVILKEFPSSVDLEIKKPKKREDKKIEPLVDYSSLKDDPTIKPLLEANDKALSFLKPKNEEDLPAACKKYIKYIKYGHANNGFITFAGSAGVGKSIMVRQIASSLGMPLHYIQGNEALSADDLLSHPTLDTVNGGYKRVLGPLLEAFSKGHGVLIDEVNMLNPAASLILNQFGDDTPFVEDDEGIRYYRHPNFVCFCTLNPGYLGTNPLNPALKSRMWVESIAEPKTAELVSRAMAFYKNKFKLAESVEKKFFSEIIKLLNFVKKESEKLSDTTEFTLRIIQKVFSFIFIQELTEEEFSNIIDNAFLDCLSLDSDNSKGADQIRQSETYKNLKQSIWSNYPLKKEGGRSVLGSKDGNELNCPTAYTVDKCIFVRAKPTIQFASLNIEESLDADEKKDLGF